MQLTMLQQEQDVPEAESPDAPLNKKLRLTQVHDKMFRRTSGISQPWAVIVDEDGILRSISGFLWWSSSHSASPLPGLSFSPRLWVSRLVPCHSALLMRCP